MIRFRTTRHLTRDIEVVEVWFDDQFIATICPPPEHMKDSPIFTVISKYLATDKIVIDRGRPDAPPVLVVPFKLT